METKEAAATEAELRRRAMESMKKKTDQAKGGEEKDEKIDAVAGKDVEDGEVEEEKKEGDAVERASKKPKLEHEGAGEQNGSAHASGGAEGSGGGDEKGEGGGTADDATAPKVSLTLPQKKKVPRWQIPEKEEKEEKAEQKSAPVAAAPVSQAAPQLAKQKSKWADSPSPTEEDRSGKDEAKKKPATNVESDLLNRAAGVGDATTALDMLEEKMGKKRGGGELSGAEGEEEEGAKEGEAKEEPMEGVESAEKEDKEEGGAEEAEKSSVGGLHRCRDVDKAYQKLNKIDEGTYGVVYRARCRETSRIVALKQVKLERAREGFPLTALRELTVLLGLRHVNIVEVIEVVVSPKKQVFMVMEYMEHDFRSLMESMKAPFRTGQVKCLMRQLLAGIEFMHKNWVIHRDLKTSNLLLDNRGNLKVCDFGLARTYRDPIQPMTPEVVTLWYRAPELLYGDKNYAVAIDMWSVGCIFAEFLLKEPLLRGKTEQAQRDKISELLGSPDEENWPGFKRLPLAKQVKYKKGGSKLRDKLPKVSYTGGPSLSDLGFDLLRGLLSYSPEARPTAEASLSHQYFAEPPLACKPEDMPTWPSQHEAPRGLKKKSPTESFQAENFFDEDSRFNRAAA